MNHMVFNKKIVTIQESNPDISISFAYEEPIEIDLWWNCVNKCIIFLSKNGEWRRVVTKLFLIVRNSNIKESRWTNCCNCCFEGVQNDTAVGIAVFLKPSKSKTFSNIVPYVARLSPNLAL